MFGMAVSAGRRFAQPLGDGLTVNALLQFAGDFGVALATSLGESRAVERGFRGERGEDLVSTVAIFAGCGCLITPPLHFGMDPEIIGVGLIQMAGSAIDGAGGNIIVGVIACDIDVAGSAAIGGVNGLGDDGFVDKEREGATVGVGLGQFAIGMALKAVAVRNDVCPSEQDRDEDQHGNGRSDATSDG